MSVRMAFLALVVCLVWVRPQIAGAQSCCNPGSSPLGGIAGGTVQGGAVEFGVAMDAFTLDQAYIGTEPVDDPGERFSQVLSTTFYARVGIGDRIVGVVELPVDNRMREQVLRTPSGPRYYKFENQGVGDLSTYVMGRVFPWTGPGRTSVNLGVGMKWPTGSNEAINDGVVVPLELQIGTGTYDPIVAASAFRLYSWGSLILVGNVRFPTRSDTGYRWGTEGNLAFLGERSLGTWRVGAELRGRSADVNDFRGKTMENTGGSRVMAGLRLAKELFGRKMTIEGSYLVPVWQNLYGLQLGVSRELVVGARYAI